MSKQLQKRISNQILPFLISFFIPGLYLINNSDKLTELGLTIIISRWLIISSIFLVMWYANDYLGYRFKGIQFYITAVAFNSIYISILLYLISMVNNVPILPEDSNSGLALFRFSTGVIIVISIQFAIRKIKKTAQLETENAELIKENYRAQLEQLRKQVNPHFLFNSLSTLRTIIRTNANQSEQFVLKLSDVYRQLLMVRETNEVSLDEELTFLESYIYLIKERHQNALEIELNIHDDSKQLKLPVFSLQLLLENCIKHNIVSESKPLKIQLYQNNLDSLIIRNNKQTKRKAESSFGIGLENLKKRYQLLGVQEGVQIADDHSQFSVTLKLL